jgi:hypothetical protein
MANKIYNITTTVSTIVAGTQIVPSRSSGRLTPPLPAALRCCQFFPRDKASLLVAQCLSIESSVVYFRVATLLS